MPVNDFRKYGHELIDLMADYFENIKSYPAQEQVIRSTAPYKKIISHFFG